jgi:hypothetical protein
LWYPNLRLAGLADKLVSVLETFAQHGGEPLVYASTVWPIDWSETAIFQRVYGRVLTPLPDGSVPDAKQAAVRGVPARQAVIESLELLHEDYAYEFQIGWNLWDLEQVEGLAPRWVRAPRLVRVVGFGPLFDNGSFEAEGHIKIDFGSDAPFLEEEAQLSEVGSKHIEENVRQLVTLTQAVEKASGATARLLWSELGESLASRLAARLDVGN